MGDVVYEGDKEAFQEEFSEIIEISKELFLKLLDSENKFDAAKAFDPFINSVARYKHQGFKEEREVRFVVSPMNEALSKYFDGMQFMGRLS